MRCFAATSFDEALPWIRSEVAVAKNPTLGKTALTILCRTPLALTLEEVSRLLRDTEQELIRLRGFTLLCVRGKWEQLPVLLKLLRDSSKEIRRRADSRLVSWLKGFNRVQTQPSRVQLEEALTELALSKAFIPTALHLEFDALLRAMVPRAFRL